MVYIDIGYWVLDQESYIVENNIFRNISYE